MREVCVFYAYDDREFFDRDECVDYERKAIVKAWEIYKAYTFFDKDMGLIMAPAESDDIEDWADWLEIAGDKSAYVIRYANLSPETEMFYRHGWGYCILNEDFNNECGTFRYDYDKDEWVKVGE